MLYESFRFNGVQLLLYELFRFNGVQLLLYDLFSFNGGNIDNWVSQLQLKRYMTS